MPRSSDARAVYIGGTAVLVSRTMVNGVQVWPVASVGSNELRVYIDATFGATVALARVQFMAGGVEITGTPISSSDAGASNAASMAFDSDANTYWTPNAGLDGVPWIGLQLASPKTFDTLVLVYASIETYYTAGAPSAFHATEGATTVITRTDEPEWSPGQTRSYTK
jgi:hypothetical protein